MNAAERTRVRVVIPCRNEVGYIERCLRSLIATDRTGLEVEVWVCDGMSDDGTRSIIERIGEEVPWIRLVDNPDRTTPHAMNLGLRPTGYSVGIILGAHAEVDTAFLRENLALLSAHPEAGCVGGIIENVYLDEASRRIGMAMGHPFGVGNAHFRTGGKEGVVDTVAFGAYRREVFDRIGFFDERLVRNQDDEFNYRLIKAGWTIRLSQRIRSRYHVRADRGKLYAQYRQYGYWKVYVNRLHKSVTTWRQLVPAAFVLFLVIGVVASLLHPHLAVLFGAGLTLYLLTGLISAHQAAGRTSDVPGVLFTFLVLHGAYGIGYLHGVWDFLLLRREPRVRSSTLTR